MKRFREIGFAIALGLVLAWGTVSIVGYALEAPEIRNYQPGKPFFTEPRSEDYARTVSQQMRDKLSREVVMRRYDSTHSLSAIFAVRLLSFLLDPIDLLLTALFAGGIYYGHRALLLRQSGKVSGSIQ